MRLLVLLTSLAAPAFAQRLPEMLLWPKGAPGSGRVVTPEAVRLNSDGEHIFTHIEQPSITPFLPSKESATGAVVIVAPGGGHSELWIDHEGYAVAEWLSRHGVAAFVVKYRLAREKGSIFTVEGTELGDMQRAIRLVRSHSAEWSLDPHRIGVMGFSAGGEVAALASTRYPTSEATGQDEIDRLSARPDFQALIYPAIPNEVRIDGQTPPAFLACGGDDRPEIAQGLPALYVRLSQAKVKAELHIYAGIGHGFGVRTTNAQPVADWTTLFLQWMKTEGFLR